MKTYNDLIDIGEDEKERMDFIVASSGSSTMFNIRANNKMSVFIASSSYGFAPNIEYTYHVIYSS